MWNCSSSALSCGPPPGSPTVVESRLRDLDVLLLTDRNTRQKHSLDTWLRVFILELHMQVKSGPTQSLDLSGTGSCAAFNFRRTARAVTRLFDALPISMTRVGE